MGILVEGIAMDAGTHPRLLMIFIDAVRSPHGAPPPGPRLDDKAAAGVAGSSQIWREAVEEGPAP